MELIEGIRQEGSSFIFDFDTDRPTDIIRLTEEVKELRLFGRVFYYAYEFADFVDSSVRTRFIHDFKFDAIPTDVRSKFITRAVDRLDGHVDLDGFSAVVYPESKSTVVSDVLEYIYMCAHKPMKSFKLVKALPQDIEFDYDAFTQTRLDSGTYTEAQKAEVLSNIRQMMDRIHSLDYFSIARDSKYKYRKYLKDFYYFENPEQEKDYARLSDGKVLLIDDVTTSGTTLSLMLQTLKCVFPRKVVIFSIVGNHKL